MAGCEKICEYSDEYVGHEMYHHKRNHIQVLSKHRKHFRGKEATLFVFENGLKEVWKSGGKSDASLECVNPNPTEENWDNYEYFRMFKRTPWGKSECYAVFFENLDEYKAALKQIQQRLVMEYAYYLHVPDVPGKVGGMYLNFSTDLSAVKRRLRRLVGTRNLKIKYMKGDFCDFYNEQKLVRIGSEDM